MAPLNRTAGVAVRPIAIARGLPPQGERKIFVAILEPVIDKIHKHSGLQATALPRAPARGQEIKLSPRNPSKLAADNYLERSSG